MQSVRRLATTAMTVLALAAPLAAAAASPGPEIPGWLHRHVGTGDGQIAPVVLQRARALYRANLSRGKVTNPCYLAMDATRPSTAPSGAPGSRFYLICEQSQTFRAVSSGYGNGRKLSGHDFSNGRQCAKNFSNAEGSKLTMGGNYLTAETRTSFKGYYSQSGKRTPFYRTFLLFDGTGETENARERAIGGHPAVFLKWQCRYKNPQSPHADDEGYVPYGSLVNYTGGRSNGCTTWSPAVSQEILSRVEGNPTTLYIYPEGRDIEAVANAAKAGRSLAQAGLYWNAACMSAIGAPRFWPKRTLQPVIDRWRASLTPAPDRPLPVCK
ncbi:murein L,D-transpeptidase catalytic domain family protein [Salipiger bermudensis]|uniref:murein L,D-transpeptidase catalytic domain family protein n=1 Tax=Salipiger bermudensis TaxID=344736 RepID=UPI001C994CBB|nr:murein L,D-transpeptidase catalytic domain family protein [Salipiger bermudensis]MBY6006105.1 murein L,D-transpeptidase catalytic domain family protein [Salipiger bermudensis]